MVALTPEMKTEIEKDLTKSGRKFNLEFQEKYGESPSYRRINDYKNEVRSRAQVPKVVPKTSQPLPKKTNGESRKKRQFRKDIGQKLADLNAVVGCLHVNIHPSQKETLERVVGSSKVSEVRQYLIKEITELAFK